MPGTTANFSIRLPEETKDKIDALARALGRPRNYLIAEAVERYIAEESWQLAEIQAGIAEDDAGLGIPHDEVMRDVYARIDQIEQQRPS
jgi:predicted transcriptional regulator